MLALRALACAEQRQVDSQDQPRYTEKKNSKSRHPVRLSDPLLAQFDCRDVYGQVEDAAAGCAQTAQTTSTSIVGVSVRLSRIPSSLN